ncbi:EamA family transporter [Kribbia dieselivorans]|uniref:EamA family transporter n=1 Tax=Kribbia dieselivorans TaxID=331526 RepID=UPI000A9EB096|nr:EamA family transporter [Kribbia dieselivorans]
MDISSRQSLGFGMVVALLSAATFGTSGPFAKSLLHSGWSPSAVVTLRVGLAALLLLWPAVSALKGNWWLVRHNAGQVIGYGLAAVAGCQVAYFYALQSLSVGVALMLEYLGIMLVIGWMWLAHGQRPRPLTLVGAALAVVGLVFVLDVLSGVQVNAIGVLWGLGAAVGLAVFYVSAGHVDEDSLPPVSFVGFSLAVGALTLIALGFVGVLPWHSASVDVVLAGVSFPWWAAIGWLAVVAGATAYVTGTMAARALGSKVAGFVGLTEVLFAVLFAWLLLGELPRSVQLFGGLLILAGVVAVRLDEGGVRLPALRRHLPSLGSLTAGRGAPSRVEATAGARSES